MSLLDIRYELLLLVTFGGKLIGDQRQLTFNFFKLFLQSDNCTFLFDFTGRPGLKLDENFFELLNPFLGSFGNRLAYLSLLALLLDKVFRGLQSGRQVPDLLHHRFAIVITLFCRRQHLDHELSKLFNPLCQTLLGTEPESCFAAGGTAWVCLDRLLPLGQQPGFFILLPTCLIGRREPRDITQDNFKHSRAEPEIEFVKPVPQPGQGFMSMLPR